MHKNYRTIYFNTKVSLKILIIVFFILFFFSCNYGVKLQYTIKKTVEKFPDKVKALKILVIPFEDLRKNNNIFTIDWKNVVPTDNVSIFFSKAVANTLHNTGIQVDIGEKDILDMKKDIQKDYNVILRGEILKFEIIGTRGLISGTIQGQVIFRYAISLPNSLYSWSNPIIGISERQNAAVVQFWSLPPLLDSALNDAILKFVLELKSSKVLEKIFWEVSCSKQY